MPRCIWIWIGFVLLLALADADAARAETLYPVWISPRLGITSTAEIPDLLERPFSKMPEVLRIKPVESSVELIDETNQNRSPRTVSNCTELLDGIDSNFGFGNRLDSLTWADWVLRCQAFVEITGYFPARDDWFNRLDLAHAALSSLPGAFLLGTNDDEQCRHLAAMRLGISLGEYEPTMKVVSGDERDVTLEAVDQADDSGYTRRIVVTIIAIGATSPDGPQTALMLADGWDTDRSRRRYPRVPALVQMIRRPSSPGGIPLVPTEPARLFNISRGYRCHQTYDEPPALKNRMLRP